MAGGVAHDINNILTIILGSVSLIPRRASADPHVAEQLRHIEDAAGRAAALTRQLLAFGRRQVMSPEVVDPGEVVRELEDMLRRVLPEDVELDVEIAARPMPVRLDRVQLEQVLMNIVANARDALPSGGWVAVRVSDGAPPFAAEAPALPPDPVWLTVADDGMGMSEEVKHHAFEPFYTTKEVGRGTGLGLATVHGIVTQIGGRVLIDSHLGTGTTVAVALPRAIGPEAERRPEAAPRAAGAGTAATVLLVEDDCAVRRVARAILAGAGYHVLAAGSGAEALAASDAFPGAIDLLVTDVVMAGMNGPAVVADIRRRRPDIKVLFTSGHPEDLVAQKGAVGAGTAFLPKPFTRATLLARVGGLLEPDPDLGRAAPIAPSVAGR